jgi:predicted Zn-dependent protease
MPTMTRLARCVVPRRPSPFLLCNCLFAGSLVLAFVSSGCDTGQGEGPGHRSQRLALTPEQELSLGTQAYREVLSKSRVLPASRPEVERVRGVGRRIVEATKIKPLLQEINLHVEQEYMAWEFNVLDDKQINAFCLPGGKVAVFTGLLPVAENDDELATVMSHEIGHALAHHASERIAREQMYQRAIQVAGGTLGSLDPQKRKQLIGLLGAGAQANSLSYDRMQESEADHIGLFLMTFAGYKPEEAIRFWERMQQATAGHGRPPEILSDHPSDARRIAQLKEWLPNAKAAKKAYDDGRVK